MPEEWMGREGAAGGGKSREGQAVDVAPNLTFAAKNGSRPRGDPNWFLGTGFRVFTAPDRVVLGAILRRRHVRFGVPLFACRNAYQRSSRFRWVLEQRLPAAKLA